MEQGLTICALACQVEREPSECEHTNCLPSWCHATLSRPSVACHLISATRDFKSHSTSWPHTKPISSFDESAGLSLKWTMAPG